MCGHPHLLFKYYLLSGNKSSVLSISTFLASSVKYYYQQLLFLCPVKMISIVESDPIDRVYAQSSLHPIIKPAQDNLSPLQKEIIRACADVYYTREPLWKLLDSIIDTDDDINIRIGRAPIDKHFGHSSNDGPDCEDLYLLTYVINYEWESYVRTFLEHGVDVQLCTDWMLCQELLYETAFVGDCYDPIIAMLEDVGDYHPDEAQYYKGGLKPSDCHDFTQYAAYASDWKFLTPFLRRHGSLHHVLCWTNAIESQAHSWIDEFYHALDLDLVSWQWRWHLLTHAITSSKVSWFTNALLLRGLDDATSERVKQIHQQLICPLSITTASHYQHYDIAKYMIVIFRNHILLNSDNSNIRLKLCANMLLQRLINYILSHSAPAKVEFLRFLVQDCHGNVNAKYIDDSVQERTKLQAVYEDLLTMDKQDRDMHRSIGFMSMADQQSFTDSIARRITPDPKNESKGKSILHRISGANAGQKFAYLIEEGHGDPWLPTGTNDMLIPYIYASNYAVKQVISYYLDHRLIPSVNSCILLNNLSPLMVACSQNATDTVEYLVTKYKVDINVKNDIGLTAIMIVAQNSNYSLLLKLFKLYCNDRIDIDVYSNGKSLRDVVFEHDLYRLKLRECFPEIWKHEKAEWSKHHKRVRK